MQRKAYSFPCFPQSSPTSSLYIWTRRGGKDLPLNTFTTSFGALQITTVQHRQATTIYILCKPTSIYALPLGLQRWRGRKTQIWEVCCVSLNLTIGKRTLNQHTLKHSAFHPCSFRAAEQNPRIPSPIGCHTTPVPRSWPSVSRTGACSHEDDDGRHKHILSPWLLRSSSNRLMGNWCTFSNHSLSHCRCIKQNNFSSV